MRLLVLKIRRMPGFKEKGFSYGEGVLKEGINVILGSNGSGKTTTCLAVRKLLWPEHPSVKELSPTSLYSVWEECGTSFHIEVEGSRSIFSSEMVFPPEQNALCYTILLDDLFEANDVEFASRISKIAYGGCDLELIRKLFSLPPRMGQKEKKLLYEKKRKLEDISCGHRELEQEELELHEIKEQIIESKKSQEILKKIKIVEEIHAKEKQLSDIQAQLKDLPKGAFSAREDDAHKYQEIILKEGGETVVLVLNDEELLNLEERVKAIQELERTLRDVKNKTLEMEVGFKERFSLLGIDKETFPKIGVEQVGELQRLWECWHAKVCELNEWDARIKAVNTKEEPSYPPESLRDGMRYLHAFLHAEDLKRLKMLLFAGPFLCLALYKYPYVCLSLCFFILGLLALLRKSSSSYFKRSFLNLGISEPEEWTTEGVRQHIARLETLWGEAVRFFTDKETAQIIAVHKKKCSDEADHLYRGLQEAGFPKEKLPWIPFVRELQRASELFIEVKKHEAILWEEEKKYHELLKEVGVKNAHDAAVLLGIEHKKSKRQKELKELAFRKMEILNRCKIRTENIEEEWKLLSECVEKREMASSLLQEKTIIETRLRELQEKLQEDRELLHMNTLSLQAYRETIETKVLNHDWLIEKQAAIRQKLEIAQTRAIFEEADHELKEAEELLEKVSLEFIHKAVAEFLLDKVEKLFELEFQPEVFKRANLWFIRFTQGTYRLHLMKYSHFAAYDMQVQEIKDLDSLSRGTRIQLILAIRLAFMETAEGTGTQLPLFLDEAMSHADDERFRYMSEALLEVAKEGRQIFYFTCQKSCVAAWQKTTLNSGLLNVIDLDKIKRDEICDDFPLMESTSSSAIPSPEGKNLLEYSKELNAIGLSTSLPPASWHLCHFVSSSEELHTLALQKILFYGQLKNLSEKGLIKFPTLIEKGKLAEYFYSLFTIGKGRKISWEDLEQGGVSERFIDKVYACAKKYDFDPKKLLIALENKEVPGFREKSREELEEMLLTLGCLDRRDVLPLDEIRALLWQYADESIATLTKEEIAQWINTLCIGS